ncbi:hypothetical protein [Cytobacillus kochii]|nr:hypothetical protein [Cytobacillus kochii]
MKTSSDSKLIDLKSNESLGVNMIITTGTLKATDIKFKKTFK